MTNQSVTPANKKPDNAGKPGPNKAAAKTEKNKSGDASKLIAIAALILALVALGLTLFGGKQLKDAQNGIGAAVDQQLDESRRTSEQLGNSIDQLEGRANDLMQMDARLQARIEADRRANDESEARLQEAVSTLRREWGMEKQEWIIAEAEYLMRIANHRLRLQADAGTAITALEMADERLRESADPAYYPVRELIAGEITQLKGIELVDQVGIAGALAALADQARSLPLTAPMAPVSNVSVKTNDVPREERDWRTAMADVWDGFRSLVVVREHDNPVNAMITPAQHFLLSENLRLQLEAARLAMLARDPALYRDSLGRAEAWISQHFDTETAAVRGAITRLQELAAVDVDPAMPDISGGLKALRALREDDAERSTGGGNGNDAEAPA